MSTPASKAKKKAKKAAGASSGVPSYEDVKALALQAPSVRRRCQGKAEDRDIGAPQDGETYKRLICGGSEVLDYAVGAGQYEENFSAARDLAFVPLWSDPGQAYVKVSGSGLGDLAEKVRQDCGCGEVVQPR